MLCEQIPEVEVVRAFNDPRKLIEESKHLEFDLCILDIEMPELSGLEVAPLLHGKPVIFTTAYKEYAAEAFDLEAIDYIRKPIKKERLEKAIQRALRMINDREPTRQFVQLNTSKGKALLFFGQILYITTSDIDKRDKLVLLDQGQEMILKNISFDKLLNLLPADQFRQVNKKEIIALRAVQYFTHDEITTTIAVNGKNKTLTLSENFRDGLVKKESTKDDVRRTNKPL